MVERQRGSKLLVSFAFCSVFVALGTSATGQLIDKSQAPNNANEGINKSYLQEIGAGRGDMATLDSSEFIIRRDPFRAIRRGRQLFQRKFTMAQGLGPRSGDGAGDANTVLAIGAGLADSCAACHGRPRGSAGFGGDVTTRPDSRDAPHLFGLGLKEMLADEITTDLRAIRASAIAEAMSRRRTITKSLRVQNISFGTITANPDGSVNTSGVQGVDPDLRVRPFFAHGGTISIREFVVGALANEMGLQSVDPDTLTASTGGVVTTPSGMVLDGTRDAIEGPPAANAMVDPDGDGIPNEVPEAIVDFFEFYLLNYFKAGTYAQTSQTARGRLTFSAMGCAVCHVPDLRIRQDRRVADVETVFDTTRGNMNRLFATATPLHSTVDDGSGHPVVKRPLLGPFVVRNIFTDFKRHDLGPNFHERNFDGTMQTKFLTTPLWGVGSTGPYGHDGRSINLTEVILRHGGEAQASRNAFASLPQFLKDDIIAFLNSLILFPPDDTASNLDPGDRTNPGYPQVAHGSIKLGVLFNDSTDAE
jgi:mono/diheme cytochrome c family protein